MEARFDDTLGVYRHENLIASPDLTDDLLATAYLRFKADNLIQTIYYEGEPGINGWMRQMGNPETIRLGAFADRGKKGIRGEKGVVFCGMAWVLNRQTLGNYMTKAEVGFGFFRHVATPREKVQLGKMMTQALFERFNIDVLIGTTPVDNRAAMEYSKSVGYGLHGPIPNYVTWEGALSDVAVSVLTKQEWQSRQAAAKTQIGSILGATQPLPQMEGVA